MPKPKDTQAPTWKALAEILGVDQNTIHLWRKLAGTPQSRDAAEWMEWQQKNNKGHGRKVSSDRERLMVEKLQEEIERLKLANAEARRETIMRTEVNELFTRVAMRQKQVLHEKLHNELPPQLAGLDAGSIRVLLDAAVIEICTQMQRLADD